MKNTSVNTAAFVSKL